MKKNKLVQTLFIGLIFPSLLFVFSPMWTSLFESTKSFEYEPKYIIDLSSRVSGLEKWDKLDIKYNNETLDSPQIVGIEFVNNGDVPIERLDFDSQINVVFEPEARIIGHKFVHVEPDDIELVSTLDKNKVLIAPTLLNSGDSFILELLVDSKTINFKAFARVSGINGLSEVQRDTKNGLYLYDVTSTGVGTTNQIMLLHFPTYILLACAFICFMACSLLDQIPQEYDHRFNFFAWVVCLVIGVFATLIAVYRMDIIFNDSKLFRFFVTIFTWFFLYLVSYKVSQAIQWACSHNKQFKSDS